MRQHSKYQHPAQRNYSILGVILLSFVLISCDSPDTIPVQQVDSRDLLSEDELQQAQQQHKKHDDTFYFGFDLRSSPQEDAAQYLPFLKYLESATGYHFKLHFTPKSSSTIEELGQNRTQFSAMGAVAFIKAQSMYGAISLVRGLNHQGKAEYQSVFVVEPDNHINNIHDIKGRKLAFGNPNSTQGHLIPRIMLMDNGISLKHLRTYGYTGSHQNCAEAVISGKYDVCGMQDQLAKKLVSEGLVKIIHTSRYYPSSGIAANKSVPTDVIERVRQALLNFDPQGGHSKELYHWDRTEMPRGFTAASANDYTELRRWSTRLSFLKNGQGQP